MADMDQGIKRLIQTHPADILALALPQVHYVGTLPVDVAAEPQLVLDTLLRIQYHGVECAVDVEAEARPRAEMAQRLFEYGSRARVVHGLPVISVVLWLESGGTPPVSPYEERIGDLLLCTWHFIGIEVYRLPAQSLLDRGLPGLLPLVPLTADGSDAATVERTAALLNAQAPAQDRDELEGLLALFAARSLDIDVIRSIYRRLRMSTDIIEQSGFYKEALAKGKAEGKAEGEAEGEARGIEAGSRNASLTALRGRFGELPPDVAQAIAEADQAALEQVLLHIATDTLEQVRARLGL